MEWKQEAEALFFMGEKMQDIAAKIGKSRRAVSAYLKACDGFEKEKERRKAQNANKRTEYQRAWDRENRPNRRGNEAEVEAALLKRQHNIDVSVLSFERIR